MKQLPALILLVCTACTAHADTTLTFRINNDNNNRVVTYYIKDGMLRFSEAGSGRINVYDSAQQVFVSADQQSGTISRIDKDIIAKRADQMNKARLQKLAEAEAEIRRKFRGMPEDQQEISESVINQMKYPEFYGAHTLLKVVAVDKPASSGDVECKLYNIRRQDKLLKQICMASPESLHMSKADYQTLRHFYHFNYTTQTQLLIASGKTDFSFVDYDEENMPGIAVQINTRFGQPELADLRLESVSDASLDASLFDAQKPDVQKPKK